MSSKLVLKYDFDPSYLDPKLDRDDFGYLSVSATTDRFSGKSGFWVQWQDVKEFGESLCGYPIASDAPIVAQWGYDMQEGDDLILRIAIEPADVRGNLKVSFVVADSHNPNLRASGSFLTNYPDLESFRAEIAMLMDNKAEQAVLAGQ